MTQNHFEPAYARLIATPGRYPVPSNEGPVEVYTLFLDRRRMRPFARLVLGDIDESYTATSIEVRTEGVQDDTAERREADAVEQAIALGKLAGDTVEETAMNIARTYPGATFSTYPSKMEGLREILNIYATPRDMIPSSDLAVAVGISS